MAAAQTLQAVFPARAQHQPLLAAARMGFLQGQDSAFSELGSLAHEPPPVLEMLSQAPLILQPPHILQAPELPQGPTEGAVLVKAAGTAASAETAFFTDWADSAAGLAVFDSIAITTYF